MCLGDSSHIFFFCTKPWAAIFQDGRLKSLWARYLINRWMDRIQILYDGSLGISDDLINFCEAFIKNKMADRGHFKEMATQKACGFDILWTSFCRGGCLDISALWVYS